MSIEVGSFRPEHVDGWNLLLHWPHIRRVLEDHAFVSLAAAVPHAPITVEINPMDACNHACTWCFTASNRHTDALDPDVLRGLISELGEFGTASIHFAGGGEPTMFPQLVSPGKRVLSQSTDPADAAQSFLAQAVAGGLTVGLITNGSRLRFLDQAELLESLAWLRLSIDAASEDRYQAIHAPRGHSLSDVHEALERIVQRRGARTEPSIGASFIVDVNTEQVRHEVLEFCQQMRDIGIDYVQLKPEMSNRGAEADAFMADLMDDVATTFAHGASFAMLNAPYDASDNSDYCWYSYLGPVVGADGSAYVCCYTYGQDEFRYGRISQDRTFVDIWSSPERAALAAAIKPRRCPSCRHSSANLLIEQLHRLGPAGWDAVSSALEQVDAGESSAAIALSDDLEWLRPGLAQLERLTVVGYNRILDFPTYRPTLFLGWSV